MPMNPENRITTARKRNMSMTTGNTGGALKRTVFEDLSALGTVLFFMHFRGSSP